MQFTRRSLLAHAGAAALFAPSLLSLTAQSARASDEEVDAFFNEGFQYCDADVLSQYWQMDLISAKANAGAKILRGEKKFLKQAIKAAKKNYTCSTSSNDNQSDADPTQAFFDAGFSYCDAEVLSNYWQMDLGAAKVNAGEKILRGDKKVLRQAIKAAKKKFTCTVGFNYKDSGTIADLWQMS